MRIAGHIVDTTSLYKYKVHHTEAKMAEATIVRTALPLEIRKYRYII